MLFNQTEIQTVRTVSDKLQKGHREIPCGAGFAQSNPLLVRPIPHNFSVKKTRSTDCRLRPVLRIRSVVNQFGIDDFSGTILNVIHTAYPFHLVGCFECFGDTFGYRHLFGKLSEHLVGGMVNLTQMRVQLTGQEQI